MAASRSSGLRRPVRVLGIVLGVVCLLIVGAFVVGHVDAGVFRPRIEAAFERATGRALHVGGALRLSLLPSPGFVAEDVSIANLPGGTRPEMIVARRISARIDLLALLGRSVHVQSVSLVDPDILLETVHGEPNWRFRPRPSGQKHSAGATSSGARFGFRLSEIDANGGHLAWRGLGKAGSGDVALDRLRAEQQDRSFTFFAAARHRETAFTVSLASAPPAGLLEGVSHRPMPLRATLTVGHDESGDRIDFDGTVTSAGGVDGRVHAALSQLADLNGLFAHAGLPRAADLKIEARLRRGEQGRWRVLSLEASVGRADLDSVRRGLSLGRFAVSATGPDAPLSVDADGSFRQVPFRIKGVAGSPDLILGDTTEGPIDLALSLAVDTLSLQGTLSHQEDGTTGLLARSAVDVSDPTPLRQLLQADAIPPIMAAGALSVSARSRAFDASFDASTLSIDAAELPVSRLTASLADPGHLVVQAAFAGAAPWLTWREDLTQSPRRANLALDGHDLPAAALSTLLAGRPVVGGRLNVRATLDGLASGAGLDERTITGPITATLLDADLDSAITRDLVGHVLHAAHLPKLGGSARIDCVSGVGSFHDGTLALTTLSLDSPFLTMSGSGSVGLPRGSLDLRVRPVLRLGATDVATEVALGGTVANPTAALAARSDGRVGIQIGRLPSDAGPSCSGSAAAKRKPPKPADFLRALGLLH